MAGILQAGRDAGQLSIARATLQTANNVAVLNANLLLLLAEQKRTNELLEKIVAATDHVARRTP